MKRIKLTGLALLAATTILVPSAFASAGHGLPVSKASVATSQGGFVATVQLASNAREVAEGEGLEAGHSGSGEHDDNDHGSMRPSHDNSNDGDHSDGGDNDSGYSGGHDGDDGHSDGDDGDGGHSGGDGDGDGGDGEGEGDDD